MSPPILTRRILRAAAWRVMPGGQGGDGRCEKDGVPTVGDLVYHDDHLPKLNWHCSQRRLPKRNPHIDIFGPRKVSFPDEVFRWRLALPGSVWVAMRTRSSGI